MNDYLEVVSPVTTQNIKDHAGLQLEMMSQILRYESMPDTEPSTLSEVFFYEHIRWTERMFSLGSELAETDFYSDFLASAEVFIASEKSNYQLGLTN
jgi:TorA maturation chaperone TorD